MLYFEDFMEDIEDLPNEFTENLTAIRQLDLQAQNIIEPLDNKINDFFNKCSQNSLSANQHNSEYDSIIKDYEKVESISEDKIKITNQTLETFNKMMKKLDTELAKFKLELEADNPGNAAAIERMVDEQLQAGATELTQRVERKRIKRGRMTSDTVSNQSGSNNISNQVITRKVMRSVLGDHNTKCDMTTNNSISGIATSSGGGGGGGQNDALMTAAVNNGSISPASSFMSSLNTPHSTKRKFDWKQASRDRLKKSERRRLKRMSRGGSEDSGTNEEGDDIRRHGGSMVDGTLSETGSNAAARTPASLNFGASFSYGSGDLVGTGTSSAAFLQHSTSRYHHHQHQNSIDDPTPASHHMLDAEEDDDEALTTPHPGTESSLYMNPSLSSGAGVGNFDSTGSGAIAEDELRYCFCNEVSYGDMIACDDPNCPREWFHYGCVNLTVAPKGSWYCRECKSRQKQTSSSSSIGGSGLSSYHYSSSQHSRR